MLGLGLEKEEGEPGRHVAKQQSLSTLNPEPL